MKKISILIICFLSIFGTSNAFFGSPSSLDLYKNIDKGIIDLESKMLSYELNGENKGILKSINIMISEDKGIGCLNESKKISQSKLKDIITNDNITEIEQLISKNCLGVDNNGNNIITIEILKSYLEYFKKYYELSQKKAIKKTKQIYKLSNIGLYADGSVENSGFDLIVDLQEIDKIIFASKSTFYGVANEDLEKKLEDLFKPLEKEINNIKQPGFLEDIILNNDLDNEEITYQPPIEYNEINQEIEIIGTNKYICSNDVNNSGLSNESISYLLNNIKENIDPSNNIEILNEIGEENQIENNTNTETNNTDVISQYNKVRDNTEWPCNQFFCINIDFIVNKNNLFGSFEFTTIEYLLNRSNAHLRKFASSSLIPSKMTTDNFELGLKDINLSEIFHIGFQISTKPVPILNIENKKKKEQGEYSVKNLLERYYKANGLDYKRRNDLNIFENLDTNKQIINNGNRTTVKNINKNFDDYNLIIKKNLEKNNLIDKAIEKKVSNGIMQNFETQFIEISKFTVGINNYIKNLDSIIDGMKQIPIDNG